jgi:hypothetical protein
MPRERPRVVLVLGILNIVFGVLGLLCGTCLGLLLLGAFGAAGAVGPPGVNMMEDMSAFLSREIPGYDFIYIGHYLLELVLAVVLIVLGIGLLRMRRWARPACIAYGAVVLLTAVGYLVFMFAVENPAMARWNEDFERRFPEWRSTTAAEQYFERLGDSLANLVAVFDAGVTGVYALVLLIVMFLPAVRAAFEPTSPSEVARYTG